MGAMQIVTGVLIEVYFNKGSMPHTAGVALIVCICLFVSGFACSWGPLGWLVRPPLRHQWLTFVNTAWRFTLLTHSCVPCGWF